MYLGDLCQTIKETLNVTDIPQFLDARYMGQIRNVTLIIIATAIMAIVTSIFAYLFDYLTSNIQGSIVRFLLQGGTNMLINLSYPDSKNSNIK